MTKSSAIFDLNPKITTTQVCGAISFPVFNYIGMTSDGMALPSFVNIDQYSG
jgi:hypothetical protein